MSSMNRHSMMNQPGMYGKGSKISYGNYSKPTYHRGSNGTGSSPFGMHMKPNQPGMLKKHMSHHKSSGKK